MANAGDPFSFPYEHRFPYAVEQIVLDAASGSRLVPGSYWALDYQGDDPPPPNHHPVAVSINLRK